MKLHVQLVSYHMIPTVAVLQNYFLHFFLDHKEYILHQFNIISFYSKLWSTYEVLDVEPLNWCQQLPASYKQLINDLKQTIDG